MPNKSAIILEGHLGRPPCVTCAKLAEDCPRPADGAVSMAQLMKCAEWVARESQRGGE